MSITFVPIGGLANRMRSIDAAMMLAEETGKELKVIWFKDQGLNCPFGELFQPIPFRGASLLVKEATFIDLLINDRPRRKNFHLPWLFERLRFNKRMYELEVTNRWHDNFDFVSWSDAPNIYIASCVRFHPCPEGKKPLSGFVPTEDLRQRIEEETAAFSAHTIGVHIRRTDNIFSIQDSPTELFIQRMQEEIAKQPETRFYLATDSEEDKRRLRQAFGERIITSPHKAERNSVEGIKNALTEMYALSHTCHILGSARSSYSETAAQLSGIVCEIIKK